MDGAKKRIDIERLVNWALVEQGFEFAGRETSHDDFSDLGTLIDTSPVQGLPSLALWTSDDALAVRMAIDTLPGQMARAVMQYGRASLRPDWAPEGYGELEPLRNKRGQQQVEYENPKSRKGNKTVKLDYWAHSRRKATVDFCRVEYAVWWRGLELLVPSVNLRMSEHLATGPEAPKEPWTAPFEGELPLSAQVRLRVYSDRDDYTPEDVLAGQLTVEELRSQMQAPIQSVPTQWAPASDAKIVVAEREDGVREAAREAMKRQLEPVGDSSSPQTKHGRS